jgi:hypothetical protein
VRYAAAPPAPHFQRDPLTLVALHLPLDGIQVFIHAKHRLFCSVVPIFPNLAYFYPSPE